MKYRLISYIGSAWRKLALAKSLILTYLQNKTKTWSGSMKKRHQRQKIEMANFLSLDTCYHCGSGHFELVDALACWRFLQSSGAPPFFIFSNRIFTIFELLFFIWYITYINTDPVACIFKGRRVLQKYILCTKVKETDFLTGNISPFWAFSKILIYSASCQYWPCSSCNNFFELSSYDSSSCKNIPPHGVWAPRPRPLMLN